MECSAVSRCVLDITLLVYEAAQYPPSRLGRAAWLIGHMIAGDTIAESNNLVDEMLQWAVEITSFGCKLDALHAGHIAAFGRIRTIGKVLNTYSQLPHTRGVKAHRISGPSIQQHCEDDTPLRDSR